MRIEMPGNEEERIAFMLAWLPQKWVPLEVIQLLYGIPTDSESLWKAVYTWERRNADIPIPQDEDSINRGTLESFMHHFDLLPIKVVAAQMAMTQESLSEILASVRKRESFPMWDLSPALVAKSVIEELTDCYNVSENHSYDKRRNVTHMYLTKEFGVEVEPLLCSISQAVGDEFIHYACDHCCLTGEPISYKYGVVLDFKKNICAALDECSIKTYLENKTLLKPLAIGRKYMLGAESLEQAVEDSENYIKQLRKTG